MPSNEKNLWEQRKDETSKAYQAFSTFRDLGEGRTVAEVSRKCQKHRSLLDRWCHQYDWKTRAEAFDRWMLEEKKRKAVKAYDQMITNHIGTANRLLKKALDALENMDTDEMSPKDIREYIKLATDLERTTRELETRSLTGEDTPTTITLADTIEAAYEKRISTQETEI